MTSKRVCPNDDPSFTRTMYTIGLLKKGMSPKEILQMRAQVYYCICIIVRSALIVAVYHWRNKFVVRVLVFLGAMLGIFINNITYYIHIQMPTQVPNPYYSNLIYALNHHIMLFSVFVSLPVQKNVSPY